MAPERATVPSIAVQQIWPSPGTVDPVAAYLGAPRPAPASRPWVVLGMVSSLDGATAVDGVSATLGGAPDRAVFRAVRALADVIVVGAGTVRAESYGPVQLAPAAIDARLAAGRPAEPPRLVIVSASLDLDPDLPVFAGERPAIVCTTTDAGAGRRAALAERTDVWEAGTGRVDVAAMLRRLRAHATVAVVEGGPTLNGELHDADLIDELCCTIAPTIAGGTSRRVVHAATAAPRPYRLASLLIEDDVLCGRWLRDRA